MAAAIGLTCLLGFDLVLALDTKDLTPASAQTLNLLQNDFFLPVVLGFALFGILGGLAVVAGRILPVWMGWVLFARASWRSSRRSPGSRCWRRCCGC